MLDVIFQYGPLTLRTFNIFAALGLLFGGAFAVRFSLKKKLNSGFLYKNGPYLFLAALLGGRIAYLLENLQVFLDYPLTSLFVWDLRYSFFGAMYALLITLFALSRKHKEDFWAWFDVVILSLLAFMFFIHLGHFFNGTQYGIPTDLPWGIAFDNQNIRYLNPIHPTQLYAALFTLMITVYSVKGSTRIHLPGVVASRALMIYCLSMFALDYLHAFPLFYTKLSFVGIAILAFIASIHTSHKTYITD